LFFVLSGFLMGGLLFVKESPLPRFYVRRVSRIVPVAFLFLIVMVGLRVAGFGGGEPLRYGGIAATFAFFTNYYLAFVNRSGPGIPVTHFWSLSVEEHAYVVLSLVAFLRRRWRVPAFVVIVSLILICWANGVRLARRTNWEDYYLIHWRSDLRVASIFMGTLVAIAVDRGWWASRPHHWGVPAGWIGTAFLLLGLSLNADSVPDVIKYVGGTTLLALGLGLVARHARAGFWNSQIVAWFGGLSFSIYIWQQPLYRFVAHGRVSAAAGVSVAMVLAIVSYYAFENRARTAINSWWDRRAARDEG
jgi:peptidoglycan/LPS O-acetylase OafA/YrhL